MLTDASVRSNASAEVGASEAAECTSSTSTSALPDTSGRHIPMGVELRPLGVRCNIQCQYCYQNPQRDAGNVNNSYDMDRMKAAITAEGGPFAMFGGEPLLVPKHDLEELWSWGLQRFGRNSVQTNGTLV